jgi:error-prone DNA polymerase
VDGAHRQLIAFPRHLSQHPGGFVIAKGRMAELVPVENASMKDRSVIQWDKDDLDALGLLKVDILAIGMLSAIRRSLEYIAARLAVRSRCRTSPDDDTATYDMICSADTVGVFQIESRAQMSMLPRLKPRRYYDLVVEVAIVRPGPIQGGMVHPYLRNRTLPDSEVDCPEELKPALLRTKGVPIFQEQVMQIAMLAADFTPARPTRCAARWRRGSGAAASRPSTSGSSAAWSRKGYTPEYAERIFKQIQGFGEYGFPESHAAGFALLAYVSSWIKCHHPDAFLCGLLNAQPMGFYAPAQLVRDAREHGVEVRPVDVRISGWESALEEGCDLPQSSRGMGSPSTQRFSAVRLGLDRIKGLAKEAGERIVAVRARRRSRPSRPGAAGPPGRSRARRAGRGRCAARAHRPSPPGGVGRGRHRHAADRDAAGHPHRRSGGRPERAERGPGDAGRLPCPRPQSEVPSARPAAAAPGRAEGRDDGAPAQLSERRPGAASGLVTHRQRPETAKGTVFVTIEDETGAVNVIVWGRVAEAQRKPLLGATLLTVYGQWQRQGEGDEAVNHLVAARLVDHTPMLNGLVSRSRDFR